ncbi:MAG: hypothetical protein A2Y65_01620 [Deltaproteobacteria bacterium RBG_13_52_11]|nr:MAG: hypothetical protein A2Y65_01620 [Deltaproteobacteria bacterium RBG_13_52_11]
MQILRGILAGLKADSAVQEVRRGLFWTAVVSRRCGLASTMMRGLCPDENKDNGNFRPPSEMTAMELAQLSLSEDISEASLGLAAINSLIDTDISAAMEINAGDILMEHGKGKNISVIGHFPFTDDLRKTARNLWIIERRQRPGDYPESDAGTYLPQSDVIAISSTTLINHTLTAILALCPPGSVKMILGPTTPMAPVLFDYGIDIISGSLVTDTSTALRYISEGANFRQLKRSGSVRLLTITKKYAEKG